MKVHPQVMFLKEEEKKCQQLGHGIKELSKVLKVIQIKIMSSIIVIY